MSAQRRIHFARSLCICAEIFLTLSPLGERVARAGVFFSPSADGDG
jgi:hypothetical protein